MYVIIVGIKKVTLIAASNNKDACELIDARGIQHINLNDKQIFQAIQASPKDQVDTVSEMTLAVPKGIRLHITNCGEIYVDECDCETLNIGSTGSYVEIKNIYTERLHCIFQNSIIMMHGVTTPFVDIQVELKTNATIDFLRTDTLLLVAKNQSIIVLNDIEVNDVYETVFADCLKIIKRKRRKKLTMTDVFGKASNGVY